MEKPKIIAYLKPTCGWSMGVRAVLKKYDLPYEDRDIINDPIQRQEMIEKSGQMLSPCVEINGQMLADVSGEEVEAWMLANKIVTPNRPRGRMRRPTSPAPTKCRRAAPLNLCALISGERGRLVSVANACIGKAADKCRVFCPLHRDNYIDWPRLRRYLLNKSYANCFKGGRHAETGSALETRGHAHRLCADDGLFARGALEPRQTRAPGRRQKRRCGREHLREPDAVRAEGGFFKISARFEA